MEQALIRIQACVFMAIHTACYKVTYLAVILYLVPVIGGELDQLENDYEYTVSREFDALSSADWVGQNCAKKVIARLNPQKLSTREVPVIFLNDVATGLISHLTGAISGGSLYRKSSFLLDHLGKQVLPDWFQISERPHLLKRLASTPFDSEGVRTQDLEIIQDGVLQTYLLTSYSGRKWAYKVPVMQVVFTTGS